MDQENEEQKSSYIEKIENNISRQKERINRGIAWLMGGIAVTIITFGSPVQIVTWGAILYGLAEMIDGNSLKSMYIRTAGWSAGKGY